MLTTNSARVLADLVSQQDKVTAAQMADFCAAAKLSLQPMVATALSASVASVTNANGARGIDWTDQSCGTVAEIGNAASTAQTVTPNSKDSAIVVQASYAVSLPISFPLSSSFTVTAMALALPRNGTSVAHG